MNETFVSDGKIHHGRTLEERNLEIEAMELTESEIEYALLVAKSNKWYRLRRCENPSFSAKSAPLEDISKKD